MFTVLFSYHQVSPSFLDFVFTFGQQINVRDFHFSGLRDESRIDERHRGYRIPGLSRSGRELRLCYNLRSVEASPNEPELGWSVRQCPVYQSFDLETGRLVSIDVKGNKVIRDRIASEMSFRRDPNRSVLCKAFSTSLSAHLIMCEWSGENWRWYINDLENKLHNVARGALATPVDRLPTRQLPSPTSVGSPTLPNDDPWMSRASTLRTLTNPWTRSGRFLSKNLTPASTWADESQLPLPAHARHNCDGTPGSVDARRLRQKLIKLYNYAVNLGSNALHQQKSSSTYDLSEEKPKVDPISATLSPPELPPNITEADVDKPAESLTFSHLQRVQYVEEKTQDASLYLKLNTEVLEELRQHYRSVVEHEQFPRELKVHCKDDLISFHKHIQDVVRDLRMLQSRTENLLKLIANRKQLLNGILEYRSAKMNEFFAKKAQESANNMEMMTRKMRITAERTERETVSMRVITSVTLFFLPATFLASFMSTDILSFKEGTQDLHIKGLWLYLELALPATALTFIAWGVFYCLAKKASRQHVVVDGVATKQV